MKKQRAKTALYILFLVLLSVVGFGVAGFNGVALSLFLGNGLLLICALVAG